MGIQGGSLIAMRGSLLRVRFDSGGCGSDVAHPDQIVGGQGKAEHPSDSLGARMHHALTGRDPTSQPPFSFPPLEQLRADLSPAIVSAYSALSYNVETRPHNAAESANASERSHSRNSEATPDA